MPRVLVVASLCALASVLSGCGGSTGGVVGAMIGVHNETGAVYVRDVPEGTGADKAGLAADDEILMIDGVYVRDLGAAAIKQRLSGDAGTGVDLTIVRGDQVLRVRVIREPPVAPSSRPPPGEERIAP